MVPHLVDGDLAILQYADYTILLLQDDLEQARDLKFILYIFEKVYGLKINFHKSELYYLGDAALRSSAYNEIFTCSVGDFPFTYLGIHIDVKRLSNAQWKPVEGKVEKRLAGWKGNFLSMGGRTVLINSCMSSVPLYMLSFLEAKEVIKRIDHSRKRMLWHEHQGKRKYHLVNWHTVCLPKDCGGLGILDMTSMNISLLCKWLWKLENEFELWHNLLQKNIFVQAISP